MRQQEHPEGCQSIIKHDCCVFTWAEELHSSRVVKHSCQLPRPVANTQCAMWQSDQESQLLARKLKLCNIAAQL